MHSRIKLPIRPILTIPLLHKMCSMCGLWFMCGLFLATIVAHSSVRVKNPAINKLTI